MLVSLYLSAIIEIHIWLILVLIDCFSILCMEVIKVFCIYDWLLVYWVFFNPFLKLLLIIESYLEKSRIISKKCSLWLLFNYLLCPRIDFPHFARQMIISIIFTINFLFWIRSVTFFARTTLLPLSNNWQTRNIYQVHHYIPAIYNS